MNAAPDTGDEHTGLCCRLTPSGRIELESTAASAGGELSTAVRSRIRRAFAAGRGPGVLHLAVCELATDLDPTLSYWRGIGKAVLAGACGGLDPADPAALVLPQASPGEISDFVQAVPPMRGAELVTGEVLEEVWSEIGEALSSEAARFEEGVRGYLKEYSSAWHVVGRVCLHLAENKRDPDFPFAFIATYVHRVSPNAKPQHMPLGKALVEYAGAGNRQKLLSLLAPLSRAAQDSELIRELVESGDIYHPLPWSPRDAHRFLREVEVYERAGLVVRMPDWWSARNRPRPRVSVTIGGRAPSSLGMDALLDFDVNLTLDGTKLSAREIRALLKSTDGLVLLKGKWVEVDRASLDAVLEQWREVQAEAEAGGIGFGQAMRMLAGIQPEQGDTDADPGQVPAWSEVVAGKWLSSRLDALRAPTIRAEISSGAGLRAELRPYQKSGVQWLWTLRGMGLGGCLADDMGLGKTIQVIGLLSMTRRRKEPGTDLLVVPASLLENWRLEMVRFAPQLRVLLAHPSSMSSAQLKGLTAQAVDAHDVVLTTYGTAMRTAWIGEHAWRSVVLDEAQAIKNPRAKQTRAVKALKSQWRLALTGTPVENRLGDLWSIFDFLNPGLLGSAKAFTRMCKSMESRGGSGYAPLRSLLRPYILRRLKTDKSVISDLPDKTEVTARCSLGKRQAALYKQAVDELGDAIGAVDGIKRRGLVLAFLMRFKQICNHPSQWLDDGVYAPEDSGKFGRLRELAESIAARQDKLLVFTQFRTMTSPLATLLTGVFGRAGLVLHGGTPVKKRQGLVTRFQTQEDVPFMVLSLKAGGTGLNLTAASHVIHFDRWWNPAVENQATDRAYRIGQKKNVLVHKFVCRGTVEERIDELIASKRKLSDEILSGGAEATLTEMGNEELMSMVSLDLSSAMER